MHTIEDMDKPIKYYTIPIRFDVESVAKLDVFAQQQCNSRSGVVRLAVAMLLKSLPPEPDEGRAGKAEPVGHLR